MTTAQPGKKGGLGLVLEENLPFHMPICKTLGLKGALGYGRNGCVIRATWNGKQVAVKQFDSAREGVSQRFVNEVRAYKMLEKAQGLYVPKVFFVSGLPGFGIKYLGLQLGRDPPPDDTRFNRWDVYCVLRDE